jgi:hypothetical protein
MAGNAFDDIGAVTLGGTVTPIAVRANPFDDIGAPPNEDPGYISLALRNALGQGLGLGFGDEITAAARSAFGSETYDEALEDERTRIEQSRQAHPWLSTGAELAGGIATPGMGAARFVQGAGSLLGRVGRSSAVGAGFGGVSGFGSGEGGLASRAESAVDGGVIGAGIGAALPALVSAYRRVRGVTVNPGDEEIAARRYFADKLRSQGLDENALQAELDRGQAATRFLRGSASLPETIADAGGVPTQRILRGIKVGGDDGDLISTRLGERQGGTIDFADRPTGSAPANQYERLREDVRLAMNSPREDYAARLARAEKGRDAEANKLYDVAYKNSEPFDLSDVIQRYALRVMDEPDPKHRRTLLLALHYFDPHGYSGREIIEAADRRLTEVDRRISAMAAEGEDITEVVTRRNALERDLRQRVEQQLNAPETRQKIRYGVNNIERFDKGKMALDDQIELATGNLRRLLVMLKNDLVSAVHSPAELGGPPRNAAYLAARDNFASKSDIIEAAKRGRSFAAGDTMLTDAEWAAMTPTEKSMFRTGQESEMARSMANTTLGPTTDFTRKLRTPAVNEQLTMTLPPLSGRSVEFPGGNREKLAEILSREQRMSQTAGSVLGNSSTAEKVVDAIDVGRITRMMRSLQTSGGVIQAGAGALGDYLERRAAIKGPRARYLAEQMLSADPDVQRGFLDLVRAEFDANTARRITDAASEWMVAIEKAAAAQGAKELAADRNRKKVGAR